MIFVPGVAFFFFFGLYGLTFIGTMSEQMFPVNVLGRIPKQKREKRLTTGRWS